MKKITKRFLATLLSVAMGVGVFQGPVYAQEVKEPETTVAETVETAEIETNIWDGNTTESVYENENYKVTYTLASYWETGYNANVKIENTGDTDIQNWYLSFEYADEITNIWNAEISEHNENQYIIKNAVWNQDIAVGGCVEFGFSAGQAFTGFPESYELIGSSKEVKEEDFSILYQLDSDWGSGFTASVTVTNNTDTVLEDWTLEFDYAREITHIWNGVIESYENGHYVIKNAGYNANIAVGESISFGFNGVGGTSEDEPVNYSLYSYKLSGENEVSFDVGSDNVENIPEMQIVMDGEYATKPLNPVRENYYFVGWYTDSNYTMEFDFSNTVITKDITLYARWLDYLCNIDSDGDGVVDSLEEYFGTNLNSEDTDEDGLSDYDEVYEAGTHPLLTDTDGNGINDYEDDIDGDGVNNGTEVLYGTNAAYEDTDIDDLSDYDELYVYFTNPTLRDTDMDGASDGWEVRKGYDPLVANEKFPLSASLGILSEANPVIAKVNLEAYDADVESLNIEKVHPHDNIYITPTIAGYLGDAYDFTIDGKFDSAELVFEYDVNLGTIGENFQPRIYYFNEESKTFEELENQVVENGKVTAITTHFSTYVLLNKVEFDKVWDTEIKTSANGNNLNIAFVVDVSGSMSGTKLSKTKTAINSFIDVLEEDDQAALITFSNTATLKSNMTNNKSTLKNAVNRMSATGLTSIYRGIEKAINVFKDSDLTGYKLMIVFTDGYDEPSTNFSTHYANLVESAKANDITIYTIGISTIDEALLTKVAESTGGKYYYASVISELQEKMDEIKDEAIDYTTDSNDDGITDYHTKLIEEGKLVLSNSSDELKGINLNYGENGELTDDCDGDGLRNDEEIIIVEKNGKTYIEMTSHPLRVHSDSDAVDDYEEIKRGTDPLRYDIKKAYVDRLCTDGHYLFEYTASDLRDDDFISGLVGYSAIVNGVWNKRELYRDLIIDYYSTYVTQDAIQDAELEEQKKYWNDTLVNWINNANDYGKVSYDTIYNINKLVSYVNGVTDVTQMEGDFVDRVSSLILKLNRISEDATELRAEVHGIKYVKNYYDSDIVKKVTGSSQEVFDKLSDGISVVTYGLDVVDTITSISEIEANKAVFEENMEALEVLSILGTDWNIRGAAKDVRDILAERYLEVYAKAIAADIGESVVDFAINKVASKVGYVAIVVAVRDVMNLLISSKTDVEQMYKILCYSELCESYTKNVYWILSDSNSMSYYDCSENNIKNVNRYLENTAQIRILGEQEYYKYVKYEGLLAAVGNFFIGLDDLKGDVEDSINSVKSRAESLNLHLSSNIKYTTS